LTNSQKNYLIKENAKKKKKNLKIEAPEIRSQRFSQHPRKGTVPKANSVEGKIISKVARENAYGEGREER